MQPVVLAGYSTSGKPRVATGVTFDGNLTLRDKIAI